MPPPKSGRGRKKPADTSAPAEPPIPPAPPYESHAEHLREELERIDLLVRAATIRWRHAIAATKPPEMWGMIHVTDIEVDAYLNARFLPPAQLPQLPPELEQALNALWGRVAEIAESTKARVNSTPAGVPLRIARLQSLFSLSDFEKDILLVCLLPELDARYRRLFGYLQDDVSRSQPGVELILQILYPVAGGPGTARAAFAATSPLLANQLIALHRGAQIDEPLPVRPARLDDRIAAYLLESDDLDGRLRSILTEAAAAGWDGLMLDPALIAQLQELAVWWGAVKENGVGAALLMRGAYGSGREEAAAATCRASDTLLLRADADTASRSPLGWEQAVDLVFREGMLRNAAVYWSRCETVASPPRPDPQAAARWEYLAAAAELYPGLCFLATDTVWDPAGCFQRKPFIRLEFPVPGYDLRRHIWQAVLPPAAEFEAPAPSLPCLAEDLANGFRLTPGQIADALASARSLALRRSPRNPLLLATDIYEGCRRQSGRRLVTFARRIEPRTQLTFDDLILPAANLRQLDEVRVRIRQRSRVYSEYGFERRLSLGKGLIVLFTGSTGTGKTMAAELLAREQGVDLYKVDLSSVVSKWVGETEKNLSQVFSEAEDANAIVFFDECDALFGKRGEVKEARDRWANIEVNFLLQRVEEYAGVVILASNLRQNIDEAFMRRIHVMVEFPSPDSESRLRIWLGMFPQGLGRPDDAEIRALANRIRLPGGSIKNIVVESAFRAASELSAEGITMRHLALSTAREYQKLGKPITKGEFGLEFYDQIEREIL